MPMTDPHNNPSASSGGAPAAAASSRPPMDDEISLWEVLAVLLRRRGTIVLTTILVAGGAATYAQLRPLQYTTSTAFRAQGTQASAGQLMALASQFGVNVPGGGEEASPAFYAELLTSRELLHRAATRSYEVEGFGAALIKDLMEIEEDTEPERDEEALETLRDEVVSVSTGRETGTVTLAVKTEWPELSVAIAQQLLDDLARFNLETRQSQAASERAFIETRVEQAREDLKIAEDSLRVFLETNRQWENSPLLRFRQDAMTRELTLRSSVLNTLVQSFIEARLAEVRDTPVITILQEPYLPPRHDPRRRVLIGLLGIILGGMLGIVLAFLVEAFARPNAGDPAREDFDRTWRGVVRSIPFVGRGKA